MPLDQESRLSFNVPAKWANRFIVVGTNDGRFRLAFAEAAPEETKAFEFHTAVMMTDADALTLGELLVQLANHWK